VSHRCVDVTIGCRGGGIHMQPHASREVRLAHNTDSGIAAFFSVVDNSYVLLSQANSKGNTRYSTNSEVHT
jgi:hypothetical protein